MSSYIDKISYISRISLSKNEYEKVENLINEIIDYSKDLIHVSLNIKNKNLNLENKNLKNIFREDFIKESILKKDILNNAPEKIESFFVVPDLIKRK